MGTSTVQNQQEQEEAKQLLKEAFPKLMSVKQTADVLNVSTRSVSKLCSQGKLKAVKVLSVWRVNRDALFEFAGLD